MTARKTNPPLPLLPVHQGLVDCTDTARRMNVALNLWLDFSERGETKDPKCPDISGLHRAAIVLSVINKVQIHDDKRNTPKPPPQGKTKHDAKKQPSGYSIDPARLAHAYAMLPTKKADQGAAEPPKEPV